MHEIDYLNMMSYVLDDYGETYLKTSNNKKEKSKNKLFIWSNIVKIDKNKLRPFGVKILLDFNSDLSNIDTWGLLFYRGAIPFLVILVCLLFFYKSNFETPL